MGLQHPAYMDILFQMSSNVRLVFNAIVYVVMTIKCSFNQKILGQADIGQIILTDKARVAMGRGESGVSRRGWVGEGEL